MMNDTEKKLLRAVTELRHLYLQQSTNARQGMSVFINWLNEKEAINWEWLWHEVRSPKATFKDVDSFLEYIKVYLSTGLNTPEWYDGLKKLSPNTLVPANTTLNTLQLQLQALLPNLPDPYYYVVTDELPFHDFNREIVPPSVLAGFPDGAIGVRVDDNFWAVAAIPYKFTDLEMPEIVEVLWPELRETATYNRDETAYLEQETNATT